MTSIQSGPEKYGVREFAWRNSGIKIEKNPKDQIIGEGIET